MREGKIVTTHSMIPGLFMALADLVDEAPEIKSIIPAKIRAGSNEYKHSKPTRRVPLRWQFKYPLHNGLKVTAIGRNSRQDVLIITGDANAVLQRMVIDGNPIVE